MIDLNKITTVRELYKALDESNLTKDQKTQILIEKGMRGIFAAVDTLGKFDRFKQLANKDKPGNA